jgi:hypothetical protein
LDNAYPSLPHRANHAKPKNIDVIPGLAYFAIATDTIGNQLGGHTLQHVQANILAGLYHGQLARIVESYAYIHKACNSIQILIKPKVNKFKLLTREYSPIPARDNPLVFAFWTCLQLESDILAELSCPQSNILQFEEEIPGPNLLAAARVDGFDEITLESYSAQLWLRKHLNSLHGMFYQPKPATTDIIPTILLEQQSKPFATIEASEANLRSISQVAPRMKWPMDLGEPSPDILHARLRAKYYGARVITYRPFVLKILAVSAQQASSPSDGGYGNEYKKSINAPHINQDAKSIDDIDTTTIRYAREGILALAHSTEAFHKVVSDIGAERFIVTNVWGTAHAQWGNVLTLSAAFRDPILKTLVEKEIGWERFEILFLRTISFLNLIATPTSALYTDLKILQHVAHVIGVRTSNTPQAMNASSSFSSTMSG